MPTEPNVSRAGFQPPMEEFLGDNADEIDRQIADGIAAEERGELVDGEIAMAEIRAELEARRRSR